MAVPFEHDSYAGRLLAEALREPNPVAVLRRRLTVARQRIEDASAEECACEEALAEAERLLPRVPIAETWALIEGDWSETMRLLAESEEADVPPRETPRPETIAIVERLIAESGADPTRDHR